MLFGLSLMSSNGASIAAGTLVALRALQTSELMATTFGTLVAKLPSLTSAALQTVTNCNPVMTLQHPLIDCKNSTILTTDQLSWRLSLATIAEN